MNLKCTYNPCDCLSEKVYRTVFQNLLVRILADKVQYDESVKDKSGTLIFLVKYQNSVIWDNVRGICAFNSNVCLPFAILNI